MVGLGPPINQILCFFCCRRSTPFKETCLYTPNITLYENTIMCQCQAPPFCRIFGIPFCRWVRGVDKYIHKCKYIWTQNILTDHVDFVVEMIAKFSKPPKFWNQPRSRKRKRWPLLRSSLSDYFCWTILYETRLPDAQDAKLWDMQGLLERF